MEYKNKKFIIIFLILMLIGTIILGLCVSSRKLENYSNNLKYKNELDSYTHSNVLEKAPRGILKRDGDSSVPKTVRFKEFDLIRSSENKPEGPWFQADSINKYDPKYVDVFKTYF